MGIACAHVGAFDHGVRKALAEGKTVHGWEVDRVAREVIRRLALPQIRSAMGDELIYQTFINKSDDFAELRAVRVIVFVMRIVLMQVHDDSLARPRRVDYDGFSASSAK